MKKPHPQRDAALTATKPRASRLKELLLAAILLPWIMIGLIAAYGGKHQLHQPSGQTATTTNSFVSPSQPPDPRRSKNGDVRGKDNDGDGRPETIYIEGYTRKDGVKVKGHYRAQR